MAWGLLSKIKNLIFPAVHLHSGCDLLRQMRGAPVLTKPADVSRLGQTAQDLFTREAGWTDLYALAYPDLSQSACGADWRATPWIM